MDGSGDGDRGFLEVVVAAALLLLELGSADVEVTVAELMRLPSSVPGP